MRSCGAINCEMGANNVPWPNNSMGFVIVGPYKPWNMKRIMKHGSIGDGLMGQGGVALVTKPWLWKT